MDIKEKIAKRHETNHAILDMLKIIIDTYPDLRFGQILYNLDLVTPDPFYEESVDTKKRIQEFINKTHF